jgi:alpha-tubulin suppressor-like RCC1 family protein
MSVFNNNTISLDELTHYGISNSNNGYVSVSSLLISLVDDLTKDWQMYNGNKEEGNELRNIEDDTLITKKYFNLIYPATGYDGTANFTNIVDGDFKQHVIVLESTDEMMFGQVWRMRLEFDERERLYFDDVEFTEELYQLNLKLDSVLYTTYELGNVVSDSKYKSKEKITNHPGYTFDDTLTESWEINVGIPNPMYGWLKVNNATASQLYNDGTIGGIYDYREISRTHGQLVDVIYEDILSYRQPSTKVNVALTVDGILHGESSYNINGDILTLVKSQPDGAIIQVRYESSLIEDTITDTFTSNGETTTFTLTESILLDEIKPIADTIYMMDTTVAAGSTVDFDITNIYNNKIIPYIQKYVYNVLDNKGWESIVEGEWVYNSELIEFVDGGIKLIPNIETVTEQQESIVTTTWDFQNSDEWTSLDDKIEIINGSIQLKTELIEHMYAELQLLPSTPFNWTFDDTNDWIYDTQNIEFNDGTVKLKPSITNIYESQYVPRINTSWDFNDENKWNYNTELLVFNNGVVKLNGTLINVLGEQDVLSDVTFDFNDNVLWTKSAEMDVVDGVVKLKGVTNTVTDYIYNSTPIAFDMSDVSVYYNADLIDQSDDGISIKLQPTYTPQDTIVDNLQWNIFDDNMYSIVNSENKSLNVENNTLSTTTTFHPRVPAIYGIPATAKIRQLDSGNGFHTCLMDSGELYVQGVNNDGQLGLGHTDEVTEWMLSLSNIRKVVCGDSHLLAIGLNNKLYATGNNTWCQLGKDFGFDTNDVGDKSYYSIDNWRLSHDGPIKDVWAGGNSSIISLAGQTANTMYWSGENRDNQLSVSKSHDRKSWWSGVDQEYKYREFVTGGWLSWDSNCRGIYSDDPDYISLSNDVSNPATWWLGTIKGYQEIFRMGKTHTHTYRKNKDSNNQNIPFSDYFKIDKSDRSLEDLTENEPILFMSGSSDDVIVGHNTKGISWRLANRYKSEVLYDVATTRYLQKTYEHVSIDNGITSTGNTVSTYKGIAAFKNASLKNAPFATYWNNVTKPPTQHSQSQSAESFNASRTYTFEVSFTNPTVLSGLIFKYDLKDTYKVSPVYTPHGGNNSTWYIYGKDGNTFSAKQTGYFLRYDVKRVVDRSYSVSTSGVWTGKFRKKTIYNCGWKYCYVSYNVNYGNQTCPAVDSNGYQTGGTIVGNSSWKSCGRSHGVKEYGYDFYKTAKTDAGVYNLKNGTYSRHPYSFLYTYSDTRTSVTTTIRTWEHVVELKWDNINAHKTFHIETMTGLDLSKVSNNSSQIKEIVGVITKGGYHIDTSYDPVECIKSSSLYNVIIYKSGKIELRDKNNPNDISYTGTSVGESVEYIGNYVSVGKDSIMWYNSTDTNFKLQTTNLVDVDTPMYVYPEYTAPVPEYVDYDTSLTVESISPISMGSGDHQELFTDEFIITLEPNESIDVTLSHDHNDYLGQLLTQVSVMNPVETSTTWGGIGVLDTTSFDKTNGIAGVLNRLQLDRDTSNESTFQLTNVVDISCGDSHCLALLDTGEVYGIGDNSKLQLGGLSEGGSYNEWTKLDIRVAAEDPALIAKDVVCGYNRSAIILENDDLLVCGERGLDYMGVGQEIWLEEEGTGNPWVAVGKEIPNIFWRFSSISNVKSIAFGKRFSMVVKHDGTVWATGSGNHLGTTSTGRRSSRDWVQSNITAVDYVICGDHYAISVKSDGTMYVTGADNPGYGTHFLPVWTNAGGLSSMGVSGYEFNMNWYEMSGTFGPSTLAKVVCGKEHTMTLGTDGFVRGTGQKIGSSSRGQLGYPIGVSPLNGSSSTRGWGLLGFVLSDITDVIDIECGAYSTYALKKDGSIWACGWNTTGELGVGNNIEIHYGPNLWRRISVESSLLGTIGLPIGSYNGKLNYISIDHMFTDDTHNNLITKIYFAHPIPNLRRIYVLFNGVLQKKTGYSFEDVPPGLTHQVDGVDVPVEYILVVEGYYPWFNSSTPIEIYEYSFISPGDYFNYWLVANDRDRSRFASDPLDVKGLLDGFCQLGVGPSDNSNNVAILYAGISGISNGEGVSKFVFTGGITGTYNPYYLSGITESTQSILLDNVFYIESLSFIEEIKPTNTNIKYALSFDNGYTWNTPTNSDIDITTHGVDADVIMDYDFNTIPSSATTLDIQMYFTTEDDDITPSVRDIKFNVKPFTFSQKQNILGDDVTLITSGTNIVSIKNNTIHKESYKIITSYITQQVSDVTRSVPTSIVIDDTVPDGTTILYSLSFDNKDNWTTANNSTDMNTFDFTSYTVDDIYLKITMTATGDVTPTINLISLKLTNTLDVFVKDIYPSETIIGIKKTGISSLLNTDNLNDVRDISINATTPTGTSIEYYGDFSTDPTTQQPISTASNLSPVVVNGDTFYLIIKLKTTDDAITPTIENVSFDLHEKDVPYIHDVDIYSTDPNIVNNMSYVPIDVSKITSIEHVVLTHDIPDNTSIKFKIDIDGVESTYDTVEMFSYYLKSDTFIADISGKTEMIIGIELSSTSERISPSISSMILNINESYDIIVSTHIDYKTNGVMYTNNTIDILDMSSIESVLINEHNPLETDVRYSVSFDGKDTWEHGNGSDFTGGYSLSELNNFLVGSDIENKNNLDIAICLISSDDGTISPSVSSLILNMTEKFNIIINTPTSYPEHGYVQTNISISLHDIESIDNVIVDETVPLTTDIKYVISTDSRNDWVTQSGSVNVSQISNVINNGMTSTEFITYLKSSDFKNVLGTDNGQTLDIMAVLISHDNIYTPSLFGITLEVSKMTQVVESTTIEYDTLSADNYITSDAIPLSSAYIISIDSIVIDETIPTGTSIKYGVSTNGTDFVYRNDSNELSSYITGLSINNIESLYIQLNISTTDTGLTPFVNSITLNSTDSREVVIDSVETYNTNNSSSIISDFILLDDRPSSDEYTIGVHKIKTITINETKPTGTDIKYSAKFSENGSWEISTGDISDVEYGHSSDDFKTWIENKDFDGINTMSIGIHLMSNDDGTATPSVGSIILDILDIGEYVSINNGVDDTFDLFMSGTNKVSLKNNEIIDNKYNIEVKYYEPYNIDRSYRVRNKRRGRGWFKRYPKNIPDISGTYPMSYRLTMTNHGMGLYIGHETLSVDSNDSSWFSVQLTVDNITGLPITGGNYVFDTHPVHCLYSCTDEHIYPADYGIYYSESSRNLQTFDSEITELQDSYGNSYSLSETGILNTSGNVVSLVYKPDLEDTLISDSMEPKIWRYVVRESDMETPWNIHILATKNNVDSDAIINSLEQQVITKDNKYIINFPSNLTGTRCVYPNEDLDIFAYTSASVVSESSIEPIVRYKYDGTNDDTRHYVGLKSLSHGNGMRILMLSNSVYILNSDINI